MIHSDNMITQQITFVVISDTKKWSQSSYRIKQWGGGAINHGDGDRAQKV